MCKNYYFLYATDICHVQKMHPSANTRITMKTYIEKVYTNKQLNQIYVFTIKNEYALYYVIEGGKKILLADMKLVSKKKKKKRMHSTSHSVRLFLCTVLFYQVCLRLYIRHRFALYCFSACHHVSAKVVMAKEGKKSNRKKKRPKLRR